MLFLFVFFFFKQKTAYEMRISDWSSDVCSSDLGVDVVHEAVDAAAGALEFGEAAALVNQPLHHLGEAVLLQVRGEDADLVGESSLAGQRFGQNLDARSEERRVGKECGSKCSSRW